LKKFYRKDIITLVDQINHVIVADGNTILVDLIKNNKLVGNIYEVTQLKVDTKYHVYKRIPIPEFKDIYIITANKLLTRAGRILEQIEFKNKYLHKVREHMSRADKILEVLGLKVGDRVKYNGKNEYRDWNHDTYDPGPGIVIEVTGRPSTPVLVMFDKPIPGKEKVSTVPSRQANISIFKREYGVNIDRNYLRVDEISPEALTKL